jgi:hypothetical protein
MAVIILNLEDFRPQKTWLFTTQNFFINMSSRSRSKSPARKTRANPVSPVASPVAAKAAPATAHAANHQPEVQLGIALVVLVAVWSRCEDGQLSLSGFAGRCNDGFPFKVPDVPVFKDLVHRVFGASMNFVLTLHVLNTISSNRCGKGYWLNNFASTLVATFAGVIAPAVLKGGDTIKTIFADHEMHHDTITLFRFFMIWYLVNYDIVGCPVEFGIWKKVSSFGGDALKILLGFGSSMYTSALVGAAVGGAHAMFSTAWFQAIVAGVVVGSAGSFFPLSKGFSLSKTVGSSNALAASFFIASDGFNMIDVAINAVLSLVKDLTTVRIDYNLNFGQTINSTITGPFGGVSNFVISVIALNYLFGGMIPMELKKGFDAFGLMDKVLAAFQLD